MTARERRLLQQRVVVPPFSATGSLIIAASCTCAAHAFTTACTPTTSREEGAVEAGVRHRKRGFRPTRRLRDARRASGRGCGRLPPTRFDWSGHTGRAACRSTATRATSAFYGRRGGLCPSSCASAAARSGSVNAAPARALPALLLAGPLAAPADKAPEPPSHRRPSCCRGSRSRRRARRLRGGLRAGKIKVGRAVAVPALELKPPRWSG